MKHDYSKFIFFLLFIVPIYVFGQTTHYVLVDTMSYFPSDIYIEVGDQVQFTHGGVGMHDVNFATNSLTGQPFNNPAEIASLPSTVQWQSEAGLMGVITFDVTGTYNYDCSMYGHASMGMVGSITVNPAQVVSENALSLQGILDLHGSGNDNYSSNDGKAIHLVAHEDITDLSIYSLSVANNGGGSDGPEYALSGSASPGDDILFYTTGNGPNSASFFTDYFGTCYSEFEITIVSSTSPTLFGNGDDPIELFENGVVIDNYGDVDGAAMDGDPYEDAWAYRNSDGTWNEGGEDCDDDGNYSVYASGCIYPICDTGGDIYGCTDDTAFNYNPNATIDDGSCVAVLEGCMDDEALNYITDANTSCVSCCEYSGCTDSTAFNYDADATINDGTCIFDTDSLSNALSLKGIIDFTVPSGGNDGKAIHLVATSDISDLSIFGIGLSYNGGGSNGQDFSLTQMSVSSGDEILLANSPDAISSYFGDCIDSFDHIVDVSINVNGDDAIELFEQSVVIQTFGDVDVDGTGEVWEYTDSWAYIVGNSWIYGGVNCTDDSQTSATSDCPYPICSTTPIDIFGCIDPDACNFNASATQNDGSCTYAEMYYDCDGNCINDADMDGECDEIDYDDGLGLNELELGSSEVIKMIDVLGRLYTKHPSGMLLFYMYSNGQVKGVLKQ